MPKQTRLAIDVGGTFTDLVELSPETGLLAFDKVPTTPEAPTRGVLDAMGKASVGFSEIAMFTHGTTLGLNALLTRTGARLAVIGTRGFRDVYLIGRTDRRVMYDITYRKPKALLERYDTFEVGGRVRFDGSEHEPFDESDARAIAAEIGRRGYESVAVSLLHSYANPSHELRMREVLREVAPEVAVTLSHELAREYREYERTSTAVLDAYIKPIVSKYLRVLEDELDAQGFTGRFLMTRSGGGEMTARAAREEPVNLILSGPAGGVIGAAALAGKIEQPNLITIDMGGTSLDASLVLDGEPVLYQGAEFEGLPINTPSLYIHTIGAGGGSLAWLDEAGALQVGPQSAGADPGPASYDRGGTEPTFTDAALVTGYLGEDYPLGGTLFLHKEKAVQALQPLSRHLKLSIPALAQGIIRISTTKITGAVRSITVDLGHNPQDFALLAFGGGGGLVAVDVAHELGIPTVIVPPGQGAFSAFGMLLADVQHDFARTNIKALAELTQASVDEAFAEMEEAAHGVLAQEGFDESRRQLTRSIDVRYVGQEHTVTLALPPDAGDRLADQMRDLFTESHRRQYGHVMEDPIEITTMRLRATGLVDKPELPEAERAADPTPEPDGVRTVYRSQAEPRVEYRRYTRENLRAGHRIVGPAVVAEHTATTVIHAGDVLEVGRYGEITIRLADNQSQEGQR